MNEDCVQVTDEGVREVMRIRQERAWLEGMLAAKHGAGYADNPYAPDDDVLVGGGKP